MSFWLCDKPVVDMMEKIRDRYHPHLLEARIAMMFSDKRRVTGSRVILGCAKKVSEEDKVLSRFDFKIILSAEDWADLSLKQRAALLDHELSHCEVERIVQTEKVGGRIKPVRDKYGRKVYTEEIKVNEDTGRPKWKCRPHDFENFTHIAERYGIDTASIIGGCFPVEKATKKEAKVVAAVSE